MNSPTSMILIEFLVIIHCFSFLSIINAQQPYDFFYFVQQWPGSYCDTKQSCCYPTTGKPKSDFGIHGLWPNRNDGSYPSNCNSSNHYDESKISDLLSRMHEEWPSLSCPSNNGSALWSHEWEKHGTCSQSVLTQRSYFESALKLKNQIGLLQLLQKAGIQPDGRTYNLGDIEQAALDGFGHEVGIECNTDVNGKSQLYQVLICVDSSASRVIECPGLPNGRCTSSIKFPSF